MNKNKHPLHRVTLMLLVAACFMTLFGIHAFAGSWWDETDRNIDVFLEKETKKGPYSSWQIGADEGGVIDAASLKVTGTQYAKISIRNMDGFYEINVEPKKVGKATATVDYTYEGTTKPYTFTFNIKKYVCPVSSIKIGNKNYASKLKYCGTYNIGKKVSGKLSVNPKSGWKIVDIGLDNWVSGKWTKIKNNKRVTLKPNTAIYVHMKKGKLEYSISLRFQKD